MDRLGIRIPGNFHRKMGIPVRMNGLIDSFGFIFLSFLPDGQDGIRIAKAI